MTKEEVCKMIDHTLLAATATKAQILKLCAEAAERSFASVCVNPVWVSLAAKQLEGKTPAVCTVIGFPLGAEKSKVKALAAKEAVLDGAGEIDMVINIGAAKEGRFDLVQEDIAAVVQSVKEAAAQKGKKALVKVIVETCYLTDQEIEGACLSAKKAGADFVKTSTGFGTPKDSSGNPLPNGAQVRHVQLMRKTVGRDMGVKASGGIRDAASARALIEAGANRLGCSAGIAIADGWSA
ncbi:MAG: deoxyribose-phosphate aldolase [Treponema sp.]|nr:deoxyribose-phosphate aldolase [Treponema sp.]MEE3435300.1 deoxyribose-phosphate aldolase [Treponema sp.]